MIPLNEITKHYDFLFNMSRKFIYLLQDREDLVQDTMLKAITHSEESDNKNVKAWLFLIMRNTYFDKYRKRHTFVEIEEDNIPAPVNIDAKIDYNHIVGRIQNKEQRAVFLYACGFKYKELSQDLKVPINTVKSYIHRGRKQLCQNTK